MPQPGAIPAEPLPAPPLVATVIPCYRVRNHIAGVIEKIGPEVTWIFCVDDHCPEESGRYIATTITDPRVRVLFHAHNQGVGGATITGIRAALAEKCTVIVKLDGDGQMNPKLIPLLIEPILKGRADYTKGNRFFDIEGLRQMPPVRIFGNAVLSFFAKASTGYWNIFDPNNGFVAIHGHVAQLLPLDRINRTFFFESDMLFRLNTIGAVVQEIPMTAQYGHEKSNLVISKIIAPFLINHLGNLTKRIFYNYFLRGFSVVSIELFFSIILLFLGIIYGSLEWWESIVTGIARPTGSVVLTAILLLVGLQLFLGFLHFDISNLPRTPLQSFGSSLLRIKTLNSASGQTDEKN
ncbi:MAG: glycosyltransferase family 2 protein [Magnetococcales bacterium]|nr:glycosyltransferase family 2 protein [Magnetococcales bacterium]